MVVLKTTSGYIIIYLHLTLLPVNSYMGTHYTVYIALGQNKPSPSEHTKKVDDRYIIISGLRNSN